MSTIGGKPLSTFQVKQMSFTLSKNGKRLKSNLPTPAKSGDKWVLKIKH